MKQQKLMEFEQFIGDCMYRWLSHQGIEEIRARMTSVNLDAKITFVLKVLPEFDLDEVLEEATEHFTDEHRKLIFVTGTHCSSHFDSSVSP